MSNIWRPGQQQPTNKQVLKARQDVFDIAMSHIRRQQMQQNQITQIHMIFVEKAFKTLFEKVGLDFDKFVADFNATIEQQQREAQQSQAESKEESKAEVKNEDK